MIPKLSAPLVKDIRTGEGIVEYVLGVAASVLTACGDVNVKYGVGVVSLLALVKGARRGLIKLVALQKGVGVGVPITPTYLAAGTVTRGVNLDPSTTTTADPPADPVKGTVDQVLAATAAPEVKP